MSDEKLRELEREVIQQGILGDVDLSHQLASAYARSDRVEDARCLLGVLSQYNPSEEVHKHFCDLEGVRFEDCPEGGSKLGTISGLVFNNTAYTMGYDIGPDSDDQYCLWTFYLAQAPGVCVMPAEMIAQIFNLLGTLPTEAVQTQRQNLLQIIKYDKAPSLHTGTRLSIKESSNSLTYFPLHFSPEGYVHSNKRSYDIPDSDIPNDAEFRLDGQIPNSWDSLFQDCWGKPYKTLQNNLHSICGQRSDAQGKPLIPPWVVMEAEDPRTVNNRSNVPLMIKVAYEVDNSLWGMHLVHDNNWATEGRPFLGILRHRLELPVRK